MTIAHFFTRTIKSKSSERTYLMCDTSVSKGYTPLWKTAETIFEIDKKDQPSSWVKRAEKHVLTAFPDLSVLKVCFPYRKKEAAQVFDIIFKNKEEVVKENGFLSRLRLFK